MNVNNKLYRLYLNQQLHQPQTNNNSEQGGNQGTPILKAPKEKPVTASISEVLAEMNKAFVVVDTKPAPENTDGEGDIVELVNKYNDLKSQLPNDEHITVDNLPTLRELRQLAEQIIQLMENGTTYVNPDVDDKFSEKGWWIAEGRRLDNIIESLNNRSAGVVEDDTVIYEPTGPDRSAETPGEITYAMLNEAHARIWAYMQELFDRYGMDDYPIDEIVYRLNEEVDVTQASFRPYQEYLSRLGEMLSRDELRTLQGMVLEYEEMLSTYHLLHDEEPLHKIKHPVFHGIAPCILAPHGLY